MIKLREISHVIKPGDMVFYKGLWCSGSRLGNNHDDIFRYIPIQINTVEFKPLSNSDQPLQAYISKFWMSPEHLIDADDDLVVKVNNDSFLIHDDKKIRDAVMNELHSIWRCTADLAFPNLFSARQWVEIAYKNLEDYEKDSIEFGEYEYHPLETAEWTRNMVLQYMYGWFDNSSDSNKRRWSNEWRDETPSFVKEYTAHITGTLYLEGKDENENRIKNWYYDVSMTKSNAYVSVYVKHKEINSMRDAVLKICDAIAYELNSQSKINQASIELNNDLNELQVENSVSMDAER